MIGFQCSATVQPVFGRTSLFPPTSQSSSPSPGFQARTAPFSPPNILDYFPGLGGDGLRVSWAHSVNSRPLLNQALMGRFIKFSFYFSSFIILFCHFLGNDLMIEADVTLAETTRYPIPIMSSPPLNVSDITLEDWLIEVVRSDTGKGIKLDFKSTRVVEPAFRVLARHADYIKGPVVLNANILPGLIVFFIISVLNFFIIF